MKINRWIFLSLPDLPWVVWRPLSLDLAFVISRKLMGIHHGVSKKNKPDKRILEVYQKFFLTSNEKVDGDEAVKNKRMKAGLDGEVENEFKKKLLFLLHTFWLYCLLYYRRFPLLCIKRDAPCQLQINWHFDFLNFPTASSLLHIREILVHWPFLEISGPQKLVVGATSALKHNFLAGTLTVTIVRPFFNDELLFCKKALCILIYFEAL